MVVKNLLVKGGRDSELFRPLVITADTLTRYQFMNIGICFQLFHFLTDRIQHISTATFKSVINFVKN